MTIRLFLITFWLIAFCMSAMGLAEEVVPYKPLYSPRYGANGGGPLQPPLVDTFVKPTQPFPVAMISLVNRYLRNEEFISAMDLSDEQVKALQDAYTEWRTAVSKHVDAVASLKLSEELLEQRDEILTEPKVRRLLEYELQRMWATNVEVALYHANIKLTPDQRKTIQHPMTRRDGFTWGGDELGAASAFGGFDKVAEIGRVRAQRALEMLTEEQWLKIENAMGKPFSFEAFGFHPSRKIAKGNCYAGNPTSKTRSEGDSIQAIDATSNDAP